MAKGGSVAAVMQHRSPATWWLLLQLARAALMALWQLACSKAFLLLWLRGIDLLLMGQVWSVSFCAQRPLVLISCPPAFCGPPGSAQQGRPLLREVQLTRACLCTVLAAQHQTLSRHACFSLACMRTLAVRLCWHWLLTVPLWHADWPCEGGQRPPSGPADHDHHGYARRAGHRRPGVPSNFCTTCLQFSRG